MSITGTQDTDALLLNHLHVITDLPRLCAVCRYWNTVVHDNSLYQMYKRSLQSMAPGVSPNDREQLFIAACHAGQYPFATYIHETYQIDLCIIRQDVCGICFNHGVDALRWFHRLDQMEPSCRRMFPPLCQLLADHCPAYTFELTASRCAIINVLIDGKPIE